MTAPKPVFIVGCPRSGNTLLGCLLNKHPELFVLFEKKLFSGLRRKWISEPHEDEAASIQRFVEQANNSIRQREIDLGVSYEEFEAQQKGRSVTFGNMLDSYLQILMRRFKPSATVWGDKSPQHTAYLTQIRRTYPQARFIFIYRDPRHIVNSLAKSSFPHASNDPMICAEVVRQYFRTYKTQKANIPSDCLLEVRYENLVREPEGAFRRVCEFLSIAFTDQSLEPADERTRLLFGWPESKAWGRVVPQSSSTLPEGAFYVEPYLADWIEAFEYDRQRRALDSTRRLFAEGCLAPFKFSAWVLDAAYRFRYSKEEKHLLQKWPTMDRIKHWLK